MNQPDVCFIRNTTHNCLNSILTWSLLILYYNCLISFQSHVHNTQVNFHHHHNHPRICPLKKFFFLHNKFEYSFMPPPRKKNSHHLEIWQWIRQRIFGISETTMQNSQYIFITHDRDAKCVWFMSHQAFVGHTQLTAMVTLKWILAFTNLHYLSFKFRYFQHHVTIHVTKSQITLKTGIHMKNISKHLK